MSQLSVKVPNTRGVEEEVGGQFYVCKFVGRCVVVTVPYSSASSRRLAAPQSLSRIACNFRLQLMLQIGYSAPKLITPCCHRK